MSVKALKAAKETIKVTWGRQVKKMSASRITGYQVQVVTNKSFTKNNKGATIKGYAKKTVKFKKPKPKTKYYVRVRTYKKIGTAKFYSNWSKVKVAKTR